MKKQQINNHYKKRAAETENSSSSNEIKLNKFSYADYVLLSSTIAYALSEELNEADLELLVAFLGMISSDIAILLIKRGLEKNNTPALDDTVEDTSIEIIDTSQRSPKKRYKKIRRKRIRRSN